MSGDIEYGKCETCGKEAPLQRTYWHYDIKCECHSPSHFEMKRHCAACAPAEPTITSVIMKTDSLEPRNCCAVARQQEEREIVERYHKMVREMHETNNINIPLVKPEKFDLQNEASCKWLVLFVLSIQEEVRKESLARQHVAERMRQDQV